jgi:3-methyladenine DNA glycosylase/8-oxoguanine DNA glycosylase
VTHLLERVHDCHPSLDPDKEARRQSEPQRLLFVLTRAELPDQPSEAQRARFVLARLTDAEAIKRLTQVPGIGRWSAEYVLLRGLSRWHVFPGDDVVRASTWRSGCN